VRPYCTADAARDLGSDTGESSDPGTYLLYAVVLHSGGAGGGHYTALVRDFRREGIWTQPETSEAEEGAPAAGGEANSAETEWVTVGNKGGGAGGVGGGDDGVGGVDTNGGSALPHGDWFYVNDERVTCATERDLEKACVVPIHPVIFMLCMPCVRTTPNSRHVPPPPPPPSPSRNSYHVSSPS
jgi:hypothetical protein